MRIALFTLSSGLLLALAIRTTLAIKIVADNTGLAQVDAVSEAAMDPIAMMKGMLGGGGKSNVIYPTPKGQDNGGTNIIDNGRRLVKYSGPMSMSPPPPPLVINPQMMNQPGMLQMPATPMGMPAAPNGMSSMLMGLTPTGLPTTGGCGGGLPMPLQPGMSGTFGPKYTDPKTSCEKPFQTKATCQPSMIDEIQTRINQLKNGYVAAPVDLDGPAEPITADYTLQMPGPSYTVPTYSFSNLLANADKKKKPAAVPGAVTPPATPGEAIPADTPAPAEGEAAPEPAAAVQTDCDDASDSATIAMMEDWTTSDSDSIMSETEATADDLADEDGLGAEELSQQEEEDLTAVVEV